MDNTGEYIEKPGLFAEPNAFICCYTGVRIFCTFAPLLNDCLQVYSHTAHTGSQKFRS